LKQARIGSNWIKMSTPNWYITWDNKLVVNCVADGRVVAIVQCGRHYMVRVGPRGCFIIEPIAPIVTRDLDDEEEMTQERRKRKPSDSDQGQAGPAGKRQYGPDRDDRTDGQGGQGICV